MNSAGSNSIHRDADLVGGQHGGNANVPSCTGCHIRVPHGGKVSRLIVTTAAPARYRVGTANFAGFVKDGKDLYQMTRHLDRQLQVLLRPAQRRSGRRGLVAGRVSRRNLGPASDPRRPRRFLGPGARLTGSGAGTRRVRPACHSPVVRRFVTIDLETVPDEELVASVGRHGGGSYAEQLKRVVADRRARTGGRSDFLPLPFHRPVAACLLEAVEERGLVTLTDAACWTDQREPERRFLERLWARLDGATVITFHGGGFDLPVLALRSLKQRVAAPGWFAEARRAGSSTHLDVKELLSGAGSGGAAPLDLYAKLVGLPGKVDVAGEDVGALYAAGDHDRIAAYCMTDVVQTWLLWLRHRLMEGSLTPDGYEESAQAAQVRLPPLLAAHLTSGEQAALSGFLERCAPYFEQPRPARRVALRASG